MKKIIAIVLLFVAPAVGVMAQSELDPELTGVLTAQQRLKEVSINKMEDSGFWYGVMPSDVGLITLRTFSGGSKSKEFIKDEQQFGLGEQDENVLGGKVEFYHRGAISFSLKPYRPLAVEGITKTISVWIAGRNTQHKLKIIVADHFGNVAVIPMGKLNFSGWKKLTVTVPPNIKQRDYHYNDRMGITINGFSVECNIDETYGRYYIYFDDLRAVTDLFAEESRDIDDIMDAW